MADEIFKKFDSNGDGQIDTKEGEQVLEEAWKFIENIPDLKGESQDGSKPSA